MIKRKKKVKGAYNKLSSRGPDRIHPSVLKYSADALTVPLTAIFNMSYTTSCLHDQWLIAQVRASPQFINIQVHV